MSRLLRTLNPTNEGDEMTRSVFSAAVGTRPFDDRRVRVLHFARSPENIHAATQFKQHAVEFPAIDATVYARH